MIKILIDTDVVLDFMLDRKPFSNYATQLFRMCELNKVKGYLSPVIYSNLYYLLKQTASHTKVVSKLKLLSKITEVLTMEKEVVINSLNSDFSDFEDGLQYFAALKNGGIDLIVTRNLKDFKKSDIAVLTPELYLKSLL